ncbi:hypothetical protein [Noviluteimonas gilva]|uniref:Uncharacterized protein n=1 Tax=Noviluteimonas gilva TaxID=2682097 RepID=A0A7C9HM90_9GAMM|nr:hypothetical protein [Lysobacter gilvus]MUV14156.1 hypothetical protein [Lysobacter gilvus]
MSRLDKPQWHGAQLNEMQGPSSLGMAVSGGAVAFSASIINPNVYVGFWTSLAFQVHVGFQFLSVAFGIVFFLCRLRNNDVISLIDQARREGLPAADLDRLETQSRRFSDISRYTIYAQILLLCVGAVSFLWLMLLHFHRALYP